MPLIIAITALSCFLVFLLFFAVLASIASRIDKGNMAKKTKTETGTETETEVEAEKEAKKEPGMMDFSEPAYGEVDPDGLKLQFGELLSIMQNGRIVVVKAKIEPSFTNNLTIQQNYHTVEDLVLNHGFETCEELQYWAVADMMSGDEAKVISFTLDSGTIQKVFDRTIVAINMGDYVQDLWIHPSLLSDATLKPETEPEQETKLATEPETNPEPQEIEKNSQQETPSIPHKGTADNFNTYNIPEQQETDAAYVLNTSSMKFHLPTCDDVAKIKPENYAESSESKEALENKGYSPCGHCNP